MSFTYNVNTDVGKIRLWIQDTDSASALFSDEEINSMLSQNDNDVRQTSAALLIALASSRARLAKKKSAGKYSEDLSMIAKELREQAKAILEMAETPWDAVVEQTFESREQLVRPLDNPATREFINKESLRGNI